jgi:GntR family transcriptional regulator/MocR family aminotransferase
MRQSSDLVRDAGPARSPHAARGRRRDRTRAAPAAYSFLAFDRDSIEPIYLQLTNRIRDAILRGELGPGTRLPSTREIAHDLKVSRNTAANAFDALMAEGFVEGRLGSGTYVARVLPDECLSAPRAPARDARTGAGASLSSRGERLAAIAAEMTGPQRAIAFRMSTPAIDAFPLETWERLHARSRPIPRRAILGYPDPAGYEPLREAIASYLRVARSVRCDADQIVVVGGTEQGIALVARALLDAGDAAWVEDPGYPGARIALESAGGRSIPVPVDAEGLEVARARRLAPAARLAYVTPSHQFPLGVTTSDERRRELLEWARDEGAWILEDDYDSEYRYTTRPAPSLQGTDAGGRTIFVGSFSKVLFPSLRLGYLVLPRDLVAPVLATKLAEAPATREQIVLADFMNEGHFFAHLRRLRALSAERQAIALAALRRLDGALEVDASDAGMFLVARLADGVSDVAVSRAAARLGVDAQALSPFYASRERAGNGLLLGYACVDEQAAREGARQLARAVESVTRHSR